MSGEIYDINDYTDENLYEILNVDIFSTNEEIKRQYKQLALKSMSF